KEIHNVIYDEVPYRPHNRSIEKPGPPRRQMVVELTNTVVTVFQENVFFFFNGCSTGQLLRQTFPNRWFRYIRDAFAPGTFADRLFRQHVDDTYDVDGDGHGRDERDQDHS